jgi:chromate transporter
MPVPPRYPTFPEALRYWLRLGCVSFGGPAGQIAIMHRELVEERRWISDRQFFEALNFCMLLPGPEAQQLATWLGWRLHGWRGGVAAGALFVLPSVFILFALSWLFMVGGEWPWMRGLFYGLTAAVMAVVAEAVLRIGKKALRSPALWALALTSFAAIFFFNISFALILPAAALIGWLGHRWVPQQFPVAGGHAAKGAATDAGVLVLPDAPAATWRRAAGILAVCLSLWWLPILAVGAWLGWQSTAFHQGVFFSKAAMVTFGGAYAVLPYVAQQAVDHYQWLSLPQMMSGLALAETTPGPLIMVLQFVGFVGGWQNPGGLTPLGAATLGAVVTTWATFLPCFLWVFLGAPHVGNLHQRPQLGAAMTAITAAVVGVILNLGVGFGLHALRPVAGGRIDWFIGALAVAAFLAMHRFKAGLLPVMVACAVAGMGWHLWIR